MGLEVTGIKGSGKGVLTHTAQIPSKGTGTLADHHNQVRPKGDGIMTPPAQTRPVVKGRGSNGSGGHKDFVG